MTPRSPLLGLRLLAFLVDFSVFCLLYWVIFYALLEPRCVNTYLSVACSTRYFGIWMSFLGVYLWGGHLFGGASFGERMMKLSHSNPEMGFFASLLRSKAMALFGLINVPALLGFVLGEGPDFLRLAWLVSYLVLTLLLILQFLFERPERFPIRSL